MLELSARMSNYFSVVMVQFMSSNVKVAIVSLGVISFLLGAIFSNLLKFRRRNKAYVPDWQLVVTGTSFAICCIVLAFILYNMLFYNWSLMPAIENVLVVVCLCLAMMNGIAYGFRLNKLSGIPQKTRSRLIEEQLLVQNLSQSQQNIALREKVIETKRKHLKSQMNPHFIFNVLTGIQHLLQKAESERAGQVFNQFRKLLMLGFMSQEKILGPLSQEIEHVEQYVELERIRLSKSFKFNWDIESDVVPDITPCPLFILQPLVENAIWHGLSNESVDEPELRLRVQWKNEDLVISVHDNGPGLQNKNQAQQKHVSRGTNIIRERLALLRHRGRLTISECPCDHPFTTGVSSELRLPLWALEPTWHQIKEKKAG